MNNQSATLQNSASPAKVKIGDAYLNIQLDRQTVGLLPIKNTRKVLVVPKQQISFIPNMPGCFLGLLNERSRILWAIDLAQMLELEAVSRNAVNYNVAIVKVNEIPLALVVQTVRGVVRVSEDKICSPIGNTSMGLVPYLKGCVPQQKEVLLVLDPEAIARSPVLHSK